MCFSLQEAVAAQSTIAHELGEMPTVSRPEVRYNKKAYLISCQAKITAL